MRTMTIHALQIGGALLLLAGSLPAIAQTPTLAVKPKVPPLGPDLAIAKLEYVGCDRLAVTVRNASSVAVTQPFAVELRILIFGGEGQSLRTANASNGVAALSSTTVVFDSASDIESGDIGYMVTADPANVVAETNEDNNGMTAGASSGLVNCPTLSIRYDTSLEGEPIEFAVSINRPFVAPVTVGYRTESGTASGGSVCGSGADFANASGKLTFAAGTTALTQKVRVTTCADRAGEASETFVLKLFNPINARLPKPRAVGTITDRPI